MVKRIYFFGDEILGNIEEIRMDPLAKATSVVFFLMVTTCVYIDADRVNCEEVYFGELGQVSYIECGVTVPKLYVYWFDGSDTSKFPIVSYEGGELRWRQGDKDKYDLTDDQFLTVMNTAITDERNYTVRIYFDEFDYETVTTELKVYSRPDTLCPEVDSCPSTCSDCYLNVTGSGDLSCHVRGSIPSFDLNWIVTNQSGITFVTHEQEKRQDEESSTYHTTRTIGYTIEGCGGIATIYCNASVSKNSFSSILHGYNKTVRIYSGNCKDSLPTSTEPTSEAKTVVVWAIIFPVVVLLLAIFLVTYFYCRKKARSRKMTIQIESGSIDEQVVLNTKEKRDPGEVKRELIEALVKYYGQFCFIKPLPWGEPIPIDILYTPCQCTVTTTKSKVSHQSSEYLSTGEFKFDTKRVLLTADLGYGKTTYTQHLVATWVSHQSALKTEKKSQRDHSVMIYLHLKEVTRTMVLSNVVQGMLPAGNNLTCSEIEGILRSNECHILLDGLDELSMSLKANATSTESSGDTKGLTIGNLLDNKINMSIYKQLRVWVTSREVDDMKSEFSLPYSKVTMLGFSQKQINEYIHKTCVYYDEQKNIPEMALFVKANVDNSDDKADYQLSKTTGKREKPSLDMPKKSEHTSATPNDSAVDNVNDKNEYVSQMHFVNENTEDISKSSVCAKLLEDYEQDSNRLPLDGESNGGKRKKDKMSNEKKNMTTSATNTAEIDEKGHNVSDQLKLLKDNVINFIEVNEIISIFSKTPLLQIMIIHIITHRILDPTGRYKEMDINKLTTIIRLVITCLESRYVQKVHKDSIKIDIKALESKLGEIAFKNNLKITLGNTEFWESEFDKEEDVKTALEIGLLKYSKSSGIGSNQLEELAFSSHSGIEFYHELFKEYLAAQYISENKAKREWLDEFIKGSTDEGTVRLLQFIFGINNPVADEAYKTLLEEKKMWNNLIDCIYEVGDPEKKKSMLVDFKDTAKRVGSNLILNVKYLERKHHRKAVTDFCKVCNDHQIKITRMTFIEYCAIDFLQEVTLPPLEFLILRGLTIDERDFIAILTSLASKPSCPEYLQFIACEVPKKLSEPNLEKLSKAMKNQEMTIYKQKTKSQMQFSVKLFNVQKGKWEISLFPEKT